MAEADTRALAVGIWQRGAPLSVDGWRIIAKAGLYDWAVVEQKRYLRRTTGDAAPPSLASLQESAQGVLVEAPPAPRLLRRPLEAGIFEGNLSELPLWVLSPKSAIPRVPMVDAEGVRRMVPDEAALTRVVHLPSVMLEDGSEVHPQLDIIASSQFGFPTMFAARVLAVILEKARARSPRFLSSDVVNISRYEIAARMEAGGLIGGSQYRQIEAALDALRTTTLHFRSSWHVKSSGKKADLVRSTGLISEYQFYDERKERQAILPDLLPPDASRSYVRLSEVLLQSLRDGYYHGVDVDYLNALSSPLAERLYLYLAKRDGDGRLTYSESLKGLGAKMALKVTAPSAILREMRPALTLLSSPLRMPTGTERQFLRGHDYDAERGMVTVTFFTKAQEQALEASIRRKGR